ncbi:MAG TPA: PfkB family carbohydrate kinase [Gaiellaceae bacterium]
MRCAVVGHVEWVEFVRVPFVPPPGQIVQGERGLEEPAGGGGVIARQVACLAGRCEFFTALGDDELGRRSERRLAELGLDVHVQRFGETRRAWVHVDATGERTITLLSEKLRPRGPLPFDGYDAVFFVSGDAEALRSARRTPFVAATARELPTLTEAGVPLDLVVGSARDAGERYDGSIEAQTVVLTEGPYGGTANGERYDAAPVPGPIVDTYGAGDSFSAALFFALARGDRLADALSLATRAGAAVITGEGPYGTQLTLEA